MPPPDSNQYIPPMIYPVRKKHTYLIPLITTLVVLSIVGYGFRNTIIRHPSGAPKKIIVEARKFAPQGKIYLSLAPIGGNAMGIYSFDTASNKLTKVFDKSGTISLTARSTDNSGKLLFSSNVSVNSNKPISNLQIFSLDSTGNIKQLTNTTSLLKRHPSWSNALGELVYGAKITGKTLGNNPDTFGVYTYKDGKEKLITNGALPTLTPDGKSVIVLRKDGLYLVSLTSTTSEKIWRLDHGGASIGSQFTISKSGKYIAWSIPNDGYIYIMKVNSWTPFSGTLSSKIPTHAFWPVFSSNEEYLAFEEVNWVLPTPTNQRLVIFDLVTPNKKTIIDLTPYDQLKMFVSEWK